MKKNSLWLGFIFLCFLLQTCREEEESIKVAHVQFALNSSSAGNVGGRTLSSLSEGSVLFISIIKQNGDQVHTLKELTLLKFGNQFISDPLPLPPGHYHITDFIVGNADHEAVYAVPQEGSSLASYVEDALPMTFAVSENEITDVGVEVISIQAHSPGEFGYETFPIEVSNPEAFKLSVYAPEENGTLTLTEIQAYILLGEDTIQSVFLPPSTNGIFFHTDPDEYYTLVLTKDSFQKYSRTFRINELQEELKGDPLSISLVPAFTMVANPYLGENGYGFSMEMWTPNPTLIGKVTVDWGDGSIEEFDVPHSYNYAMNHVYPTAGKWFVSVSGDLDVVEYLSIFYGPPLEAISLRYLTELKSVGIGVTPTPSTIDISHNTKLESVVFGMTYVTTLDISNNHRLKEVNLLFNIDFSVESLNQLIHDLLRNARDYHITGGMLVIVGSGSGNGIIIGPPSATALDELRILRDDYGWWIEPITF